MKKVCRVSGVIFLLFGVFLFAVNKASVTGAVAGIAIKSQAAFILGLISIAISAVLLVVARATLEERIVSPLEFAVRVNEAEDDPKKRAIIIDTSAVLDYTPEEIKKMLASYDKAFIPREVIKEVKNKEREWGYRNTPRANLLERYAEENKTLVDKNTIKRYRGIARRYLEQTEKAKFYDVITPILDEKDLRKREEMVSDLPRDMLSEYIRVTRRAIKYLKKKRKPITEESFRKQLENNYRVSKADIDVLATALLQARRGKTAIIQEKDSDFEQAVDSIEEKARAPGARNIARYIKCVDPYLN